MAGTQSSPGLQMTSLDVFTMALQLCNAITTGMTPSPRLLESAKLYYNMQVDFWNAQPGLTASVVQLVTQLNAPTLIPGSDMLGYSIGVQATGGPVPDIVVPYPVTTFCRASVLTQPLSGGANTTGAEVALEIVNDQTLQNISVKYVQSTIPKQIYLMKGNPIGYVYLFPVPAPPYCPLVLYIWSQLPLVTSFSQIMAVPTGWLQVIVYDLASRLASGGIGNPLTATQCAVKSAEFLKVLQSINVREYNPRGPIGLSSSTSSKDPYWFLSGMSGRFRGGR